MKRAAILLSFALLICTVTACGTQTTLPVVEPTPTNTATPEPTVPPTETPLTAIPTPVDFLNITFEIEGNKVTLTHGTAEMEAAPGSAARVIIRHFGNEAFGDLNGDAHVDAAFLVTQEGGGSGTFFYIVAVTGSAQGFTATNAVFIGDRVAPQTTRIENQLVVINYMDRKPDEDFTVQPSMGVTRYYKLSDGMLMETMLSAQITNRTWKWVRTQLNDGTVITPTRQDAFTILFSEDGNVSGTTDCNNFFGSYTLQENLLSFGALASTKMYCEDSQESIFLKYLVEVQSFLLVDNQLILEIKYDSGQVIFE